MLNASSAPCQSVMSFMSHCLSQAHRGPIQAEAKDPLGTKAQLTHGVVYFILGSILSSFWASLWVKMAKTEHDTEIDGKEVIQAAYCGIILKYPHEAVRKLLCPAESRAPHSYHLALQFHHTSTRSHFNSTTLQLSLAVSHFDSTTLQPFSLHFNWTTLQSIILLSHTSIQPYFDNLTIQFQFNHPQSSHALIISHLSSSTLLPSHTSI